MKIAIFGGSFDPVHLAHIKLAKLAFEELSLDKIIFVPVYKNPFKKNNVIQNGKHRVNMLKIILKENWEICEFELKRNRITYAYEVVDHLYKKENELYYFIGSDHLKTLNKWKNINKMKDKVKFILFKRSNKLINKLNIKKYDIKVLNNNIYNYSSSEYKNGDINLIDRKVQIYIADNLLYLDIMMVNILPLNRYIHSKNTAILAKEYAKINNLNSKDAYYAGWIHDFTKYWTIKEHYEIMERCGLSHDDIPIPILHQYSVALWMKYEFLIKSNDIYSSISKHTTADVNMSKFDKIIYLADKLSRGRKFNDIKFLRDLALINIDEAFLKMLELSKNFIIEKNDTIDEKSLLIFKKWLK